MKWYKLLIKEVIEFIVNRETEILAQFGGSVQF